VTHFLRRWRHWLALAVALVCLGAYMVWSVQSDRARLEVFERERLTTQSKVVEENLSRQLAAINLSLESIISDLPYWAGQKDGQERAIRSLASMEESMSSVRTFLVLDAQGNITLSNRTELIHRNVAQRDYFQAPLRSLNPNTLFVSAPFNSVLNNYVLNLSRVVLDDKGQFAGVVSASVDPVDIEILLNSVRYTDDMRSMLIHGDGKVFVVQPPRAELLGKDLVYSTDDDRLPVLRTIQPPALRMDKPLVIAVSRHRPALLAPLLADQVNKLLVYLLLLALSVSALWFYLNQRERVHLSNQRLRLATEAAGVGIWEFDLKTRRYHWDAAMFDLFGLDPQKVNALNDDWRNLTLPGELKRIKDATRQAIKLHQQFDVTFRILRPDGEVRFMRNRAAMYGVDIEAPHRMIGSTEDVTERKMREADLRIAAIAFNCQEGMTVTDANQTILRINRAFSDLFGYAAEEVLGRTPRLLQSGRHDAAFYKTMWADIEHKGLWQGEVWSRRKNGEVFSEWLTVTTVFDSAGLITHYVATHTDITLRKSAEDEIKRLAFFDPLTNLPNRRLLADRLRQAVAHAKRERGCLALIFVDLDRFKPVNDRHGHAAGDQLLHAVAHRLRSCVRESDTVARVGGDEFVVLLDGISQAHDAMQVTEKIHEVLRESFLLADGQRVNVSSSAGVALYPEHGQDEATLSHHADVAMYAAKAAGRDQYVVYDPSMDQPLAAATPNSPSAQAASQPTP
jgi:diguanylate cyclase (GGDEF)-like protein/PAS domain S-box-containing protein